MRPPPLSEQPTLDDVTLHDPPSERKRWVVVVDDDRDIQIGRAHV